MEKNFKNYIYTDKFEYVKKEKSKECIFCKINLIENTLIHQTDEMLIILNKFPYNPGHIMIIPKRHVLNIEELSDSEVIKLFQLLKLLKRVLIATHNPQGFNIGINIGKVAGGSISHLHVHLVPRYENELNFLEVTSGTRVIVEKLEDTLKKIKDEFNKICNEDGIK